ncbi:hypothetical protein [Kitasatospora sp. NPDC001683]
MRRSSRRRRTALHPGSPFAPTAAPARTRRARTRPDGQPPQSDGPLDRPRLPPFPVPFPTRRFVLSLSHRAAHGSRQDELVPAPGDGRRYARRRHRPQDARRRGRQDRVAERSAQ